MTLTEEQIAEIRARVEAATPGPWRLYGVALKEQDVDFLDHARDDIPALLSALEAANKRADEAEALAERLKHEAQHHAQEARTANATIAEIYREVSGGKGEPGNWNGAEPARAELTTLRARVAELEALLKDANTPYTQREISNLVFDGNSVSFWRDKAKAYGGAASALRARVAELESALKNIDRMTYKSDGDRREMIRARVHAALKGTS